MRILVTGGAGFIGSHFTRLLVRKGYKINVIDKLTYAGRKENIKDVIKDIKFIKGDISNSYDVSRAIKGCSVIINFAAESHVDRSIKSPAPFLATNFFGTYVLLTKALEKNIDLFIQISSDEVYGSINSGCFDEGAALNPTSPYAVTKAAADLLCLSFQKTYGLPLIVIRPSNNYGPYQYPEKLISLSIVKAIKGKKIPIYGKGRNMRDWLFVGDNCKAIKLILEKGKQNEIYNVSSGEKKANIEVVRTIIKSLNRGNNLIKYVKDRPGHDFRYSIDASKVKKIGWQPKTKFKDGINKTISWYLGNESFWKKII